jgi:phenylalanyl-tRNA synthetase beta chain
LRLLVSWLRDFVDVPVPPDDLAQVLSMRGFEVASVEPAPAGPIRPDPTSPTSPGLPADLPDAVIDLEITPNRPDCLGVLALALEVATAYDLPIRPLDRVWPGGPVAEPPSAGPSAAEAALAGLRVVIEDPDLCPRYAAAVADVRIGASPAWLANRLEASGIRPISNLVDVTNYVLIETGHPMHAFDLSRLTGGELRIRRARAGERIRTLDGIERELAGDMLVIADAADPQAIAGVMGGGGSEVWGGTRAVAFESAYFKPVSVRYTSRRTGLKTEASSRFERGADIAAPPRALQRAIALTTAIGAGQVRPGRIDCYPSPRAALLVPLRRARITHVLGTPVADADVERTLGGLGFGLAAAPDGWRVSVPTARVDVTREEDLIEEVARHYGYDRLPTTLPALHDLPPARPAALARQRVIRRVLTAAGFSEAQTYAFIEERAAAPFREGGESVAIAYPLSEKYAVLRPSLVPGLIDAVAVNRSRGIGDVRLFEVGSVFRAETGEVRRVGLVWAGAASREHWSSPPRTVDFFDLKGAVVALLCALELDAAFNAAQRAELAPGRAAVAAAAGRTLGWLGQLAPSLAAARGLPSGDEIYVAEFDLGIVEDLAPAGDRLAMPLPRFPAVVRDLALHVGDNVSASSIRETIRAAAPPTLVAVEEFDRYQGPTVPAGRVSLAFHLTFRAPDRTLVDTEVQQAIQTIVSALQREHGAVQR